jgi:formylglycine-generating enzyme required for sulfatase activity/energy-coupling factor transporter ATP-binding protein EcfA2
MQRVFISFATDDERLAVGLAAELDAAGVVVARDAAGDIEIDPGDWRAAVDDSEAVIVLVGASGLQQSQMLHVALAGDANRRVIPVLLLGAARPARAEMPYELADVPWIEAERNVEPLGTLVANHLGQHQLPVVDLSVVAEKSPYRGLAPFEESDAEDFFGREGLVASVSDEVARGVRLTGAPFRFLAVVGPSGSGKSSLVLAGVVPHLRRTLADDGGVASVIVTRPGSRPLEAIAKDIIAAGSGAAENFATCIDADLRTNSRALHRLLDHHDADAGYTVVVVDQFEELFTMSNSTDRAAYIANVLNSAAAPGGRTIIVITLRADFYGHCATDPRLAFYVQSRQALVGRMTDQEIRRAIQAPAERRGVKFAAGLVERLLRDVGDDAGSLPLLEFALMQLWREQSGGDLSHESYEAIGGVGGALAERADALYAELSISGRELCRRLLMRLIQPGEGTVDTRRRVHRGDLRFRDQPDSAVDQMLDALAAPDVRLVTLDGTQDGATIEITHEALLTRWPLLVRWRDEDREALLFHRRLISGSAEWLRTGDDSSLLQGTILLRAVEWAEAHSDMVNVDEEHYIAASVERSLTTSLDCAPEALAAALEKAQAFAHALEPAVRSCLGRVRDSELRRRLLMLAANRSPDENNELIESLRTASPIEFMLVAGALRPTASAEWMQSLFSSQPGGGDLRQLLTAAAIAPEHEMWPRTGARFAELLANEDAVAVGAWLPTVRLVSAEIAGPLLAIACDAQAEQRRRLTAGRILVLVAGDEPAVVAALLATDEPALYVAARECVEPARRVPTSGVEAALDETASCGSASVSVRGGALAALADLGAWTLARARVEDAGVDAAAYEFARYLWLRGVKADAVAGQLHGGAPGSWIIPIALALCEYRPDAISSDILERVTALFADHPSAAVHAACGLLISRALGEQERWRLDRALASSSIECPGDREWCVWDGTGAPLTFVVIRAGQFTMGSPASEFGRGEGESRHDVVLSDDLLLADRVLTRDEYERTANAAEFAPHIQGIEETCPTRKHPAIMMTWEEAMTVCRYLTSKTKADLINIDLPSEAEWEYACRAGSVTAYHFGDDPRRLDLYGWYLGNAEGRHAREPRKLWPNQWGLFDMHGLLYEWCRDYYGPYDVGRSVDPDGSDGARGEGAIRVLRGGGYNYSAQDCRAAYRYFTHETNRHPRIGLRLAARRSRVPTRPHRPGGS